MAKVGLQLYSLKEAAQKDLVGLLKTVAQIGYDGVEFAGYFDTPAETLRHTLQDLQLGVSGTHIGSEALKHNLDGVLAYSAAIDCPTVICPGFWGVDLKQERSFRDMGQFFNQVGARCRQHGLQFRYHIHGHEFEMFAGRSGLDVMLAEIDPPNMTLQPDTCWVESAGLDAVQFLKTYGPRCGSVHLKDIRSRADRHDTEVGTGAIDMRGVIAEAQALSIEWLVVEQEQYTIPPLESVAISLNNIRAMLAA